MDEPKCEKRGELGILARMLVAGLLCGLVWETFNFFAPQKWIYTVRGLEQLKLFEMPLLGFLGFPALAADAFAAFSTISYCFHGNVTWENPKDVAEPALARRPLSRPIFVALLPLHFVFWGGHHLFHANSEHRVGPTGTRAVGNSPAEVRSDSGGSRHRATASPLGDQGGC
jgi:hypothetical protein